MPGNQFYGEISSCSNCTDYQSRRLHIRSVKKENDSNEFLKSYVHTLNGTACAIPRMLTAIVESNWDAVIYFIIDFFINKFYFKFNF